MILLLNGSFGIGKTTVARRLRRRLNGAVVFDPELVGAALSLIPFRRRLDDYQDLTAWRRLTIAGVRAVRRLRPVVIVPMAFTNLDYLDEIRTGVGLVDGDVRHLCLVAPLKVVLERLAVRTGVPGGIPDAWQVRRAKECCAVHGLPAFADQVPAWGRSPDEIVLDILARLGGERDVTRLRAP